MKEKIKRHTLVLNVKPNIAVHILLTKNAAPVVLVLLKIIMIFVKQEIAALKIMTNLVTNVKLIKQSYRQINFALLITVEK